MRMMENRMETTILGLGFLEPSCFSVQGRQAQSVLLSFHKPCMEVSEILLLGLKV